MNTKVYCIIELWFLDHFEWLLWCFVYLTYLNQPNRLNREKVTLKEGVFVESVFNVQCHIVKNTLLHTAVYAILPAGNLSLALQNSKDLVWLFTSRRLLLIMFCITFITLEIVGSSKGFWCYHTFKLNVRVMRKCKRVWLEEFQKYSSLQECNLFLSLGIATFLSLILLGCQEYSDKNTCPKPKPQVLQTRKWY